MNIALIAHDGKKELLVQLCIAYCGILSSHTIISTATAGNLIAETTGLPVSCQISHGYDGAQQLGARIAYNEIDLVLFLCDPSADKEQLDAANLVARFCDQHTVPYASNIATAEVLIHGLKRGDLDWRIM